MAELDTVTKGGGTVVDRDLPNGTKNYAEQYLLFLAGKYSFGMVPRGLYEKRDAGGNRKRVITGVAIL